MMKSSSVERDEFSVVAWRLTGIQRSGWGGGRSFHRPGTVNENVLESDFEPLWWYHEASLTSRSQTSGNHSDLNSKHVWRFYMFFWFSGLWSVYWLKCQRQHCWYKLWWLWIKNLIWRESNRHGSCTLSIALWSANEYWNPLTDSPPLQSVLDELEAERRFKCLHRHPSDWFAESNVFYRLSESRTLIQWNGPLRITVWSGPGFFFIWPQATGYFLCI